MHKPLQNSKLSANLARNLATSPKIPPKEPYRPKTSKMDPDTSKFGLLATNMTSNTSNIPAKHYILN